jgi:hypothetical protein
VLGRENHVTIFGDTLRKFRQASNDPERLNRRLSQERLGELNNWGYTGAAISEWELGKSRISADDRDILLALVNVFRMCGGIQTVLDANQLLEAGNYRPLDQEEIRNTVWIEIAAAIVSVLLGSMAARVVPHNLWRAFKRLTFRDGWIFFVVTLMGPLWAFFFLEYYSTLLHPTFGIIVILLALSAVVLFARKRSKKQTE